MFLIDSFNESDLKICDKKDHHFLLKGLFLNLLLIGSIELGQVQYILEPFRPLTYV